MVNQLNLGSRHEKLRHLKVFVEEPCMHLPKIFFIFQILKKYFQSQKATATVITKMQPILKNQITCCGFVMLHFRFQTDAKANYVPVVVNYKLNPDLDLPSTSQRHYVKLVITGIIWLPFLLTRQHLFHHQS